MSIRDNDDVVCETHHSDPRKIGCKHRNEKNKKKNS